MTCTTKKTTEHKYCCKCKEICIPGVTRIGAAVRELRQLRLRLRQPGATLATNVQQRLPGLLRLPLPGPRGPQADGLPGDQGNSVRGAPWSGSARTAAIAAVAGRPRLPARRRPRLARPLRRPAPLEAAAAAEDDQHIARRLRTSATAEAISERGSVIVERPFRPPALLAGGRIFLPASLRCKASFQVHRPPVLLRRMALRPKTAGSRTAGRRRCGWRVRLVNRTGRGVRLAPDRSCGPVPETADPGALPLVVLDLRGGTHIFRLADRAPRTGDGPRD